MMILVVRINHTKDRVGLYKAEIVYGMNKISHFSIPSRTCAAATH